jgi:hypothetical protein
MEKFTLKDGLVKCSLKKISEMNAHNPWFSPILVGGLAVQLYTIKPEFYRPTNDADLMILEKISPGEFRTNIGEEISKDLQNKGYAVKLGKARYGYEIRTRQGRQLFFIHLSKFSDSYMERHCHWKKREFENAKIISLSKLGRYPLIVHRLEDILSNKARRLHKLEKGGYVYGKNLEEWQKFLAKEFEELGKIDLGKKLENTKKIRQNLVGIGPENFLKNIDLLNYYKVIKDLYDIAVLSRTIIEGKEKLEYSYLDNALSTIPSIK